MPDSTPDSTSVSLSNPQLDVFSAALLSPPTPNNHLVHHCRKAPRLLATSLAAVQQRPYSPHADLQPQADFGSPFSQQLLPCPVPGQTGREQKFSPLPHSLYPPALFLYTLPTPPPPAVRDIALSPLHPLCPFPKLRDWIMSFFEALFPPSPCCKGLGGGPVGPLLSLSSRARGGARGGTVRGLRWWDRDVGMPRIQDCLHKLESTNGSTACPPHVPRPSLSSPPLLRRG